MKIIKWKFIYTYIPNFPAGRGLYLYWELEGEETSARSDTSSVHDRGRVKPVCKTCSETGLEKQIVRMLRAELRCNDIEDINYFADLRMTFRQNFFLQDCFRNKFGIGLG
jgi:hypothetical protein